MTAAINGPQLQSPNCELLNAKQAKNTEWVWTMRTLNQSCIKKKKITRKDWVKQRTFPRKTGNGWKNLGCNIENLCGEKVDHCFQRNKPLQFPANSDGFVLPMETEV